VTRYISRIKLSLGCKPVGIKIVWKLGEHRGLKVTLIQWKISLGWKTVGMIDSWKEHKQKPQSQWRIQGRGQIRTWPPSSFATDFGPTLQRRNKSEILGNIAYWIPPRRMSGSSTVQSYTHINTPANRKCLLAAKTVGTKLHRSLKSADQALFVFVSAWR